MNENKNATGCGDIQTAQQNIFRLNFIQNIVSLKTAFFRVAAWLSIVGGSLC
ncbi:MULTISPECIES: hypothetical protein [Methylobacter]